MTYRERRERRAERLREWADKRDARQPALNEAARADEAATGIPFGQPILVGHHSERRHRRAIERVDRNMRAAVDNSRTAASMNGRAQEIERQLDTAIYDDDTDAIDRLREKIAGLERQREHIKRLNAAARKGTLTDEQRLELARANQHAPIAGKHGGYPAYHLQNLSGNISRLRKRLERLERQAVNPQANDRTITARYAGECADCGHKLERGQLIRYSRAAGARCVQCPAPAGEPGEQLGLIA